MGELSSASGADLSCTECSRAREIRTERNGEAPVQPHLRCGKITQLWCIDPCLLNEAFRNISCFVHLVQKQETKTWPFLKAPILNFGAGSQLRHNSPILSALLNEKNNHLD